MSSKFRRTVEDESPDVVSAKEVLVIQPQSVAPTQKSEEAWLAQLPLSKHGVCMSEINSMTLYMLYSNC